MPSEIYSCTLWLKRRRVETFDTALDLEEPASLEHALAEAVRRHRGQNADITEYKLTVRTPAESRKFIDYRHTPWLNNKQQT